MVAPIHTMGRGFLIQVFGLAAFGGEKPALEVGEAYFGGLPTPRVDRHWLQNLRLKLRSVAS